MWKKTKKQQQQQQQQMKYINALKIEWNKQMCQVFFNVCVYTKEKINLTWPYLVHDVCLNFLAPMQRFTIFLDQLLNPYYQNEIPSSTIVCCMTKISNMFLAQYWRLETGFRTFYDFIKITISQNLVIFIFHIYHFWMAHIHLLKKMKHWNLEIIGYWVIGAGC